MIDKVKQISSVPCITLRCILNHQTFLMFRFFIRYMPFWHLSYFANEGSGRDDDTPYYAPSTSLGNTFADSKADDTIPNKQDGTGVVGNSVLVKGRQNMEKSAILTQAFAFLSLSFQTSCLHFVSSAKNTINGGVLPIMNIAAKLSRMNKTTNAQDWVITPGFVNFGRLTHRRSTAPRWYWGQAVMR